MSMTLARYLKDFGEPQSVTTGFPGAGSASGLTDADASMLAGLPGIDEPEPVDIAAERRAAYAEGHEAASAELLSLHQAELERITAQGEEDAAALSRRYETDIALSVAATLREIARRIASDVGDQVATVLAPVMTEAVAVLAVGNLASLLEAAILDGAAGQITVKGPRHLFVVLEADLGDNAGLLRHVETADLDLSAEIDGSVLVTRLSAWSASLKKILE